jgi:hypothetical protein
MRPIVSTVFALAFPFALSTLAGCSSGKDVAQATAPTCPPATVAAAAPVTTAPVTTTPATTSVVPVKTEVKAAPAAAKSDPTVTAKKLSIARIAIARDVKNREPIDVGTRFDASEPKVFVYLDVHNTEKVPGKVFVEFVSPKKRAGGDIELSVGATDHWRTWAFTRLAKEPGTWKVRVKNEQGAVIAEESFEVFSID